MVRFNDIVIDGVFDNVVSYLDGSGLYSLGATSKKLCKFVRRRLGVLRCDYCKSKIKVIRFQFYKPSTSKVIPEYITLICKSCGIHKI
jgi:hypothetical protein